MGEERARKTAMRQGTIRCEVAREKQAESARVRERPGCPTLRWLVRGVLRDAAVPAKMYRCLAGFCSGSSRSVSRRRSTRAGHAGRDSRPLGWNNSPLTSSRCKSNTMSASA